MVGNGSFELLICGGTVVDGTGAAPFSAAVGVARGAAGETARLVVLRDADAIDDAIGKTARLVHADGKVVAPGFIDLHSHSGLVLLAERKHEPKVRQGVTTEVVGVDGLSYAPIDDPQRLVELVEMNAGLDGRPNGVDYDWGSVASYLDRFDAGTGVNVALLVGNSALRLNSTGWEEREPTSAEMASMRSQFREAMEAGAYGLSSGLDYPPGAYASTEELADLASVAAKLGGFYHS